MTYKFLNVPWTVDGATDLPIAVIEDTPDGLGIAEIGPRTRHNLAIAEYIVRLHNTHLHQDLSNKTQDEN